jgi:DnaJ-class molecular chaperone
MTCSECAGTGRVWLEMPDSLLVFYGDEARAERAAGATLKTVFRCDGCAGTGKIKSHKIRTRPSLKTVKVK